MSLLFGVMIYLFIGLCLTVVFLRMSKEPVFRDELAQLIIILGWPLVVALTICFGYKAFLTRGNTK